jgi:hypothetical protein
VSGSKTSGSTSYTWTVDTTPPTLSSITRTDASPSGANPLRFTLTFSEPVSGVTASDFAAVKGTGVTGTPSVGTPTPNSGSAPQTTWTVPIATTGMSGTSASNSTIGLNLTSASGIKDAAGNPLSTNSLTGQTYVFDTTPPTITSLTRTDPSPTNADPIHWTAAFSKPVKNVSTSNFGLNLTLKSGTATVFQVAPVGSSPAAQWTVTVKTSGAQGYDTSTIQLKLANNGSAPNQIQDASGNLLSPAGLPFPGDTYLFDTTAPAAPILDIYPPNPNTTATSTFTWHDTSSDVDHYLCSIENGAFQTTVPSDGQSAQPCASPLTYNIPNSNNGTHQFAVQAVDAAGNVSQSTKYSWNVQKNSGVNYTIGAAAIPPILPTTSPSGATPINLTFQNPNTDTDQVTTLTIAITSITDTHGNEISQLNGGSGTCATTQYQLKDYSGGTFYIPVGSSSLQSLSIPQSQWPSVRWVDDIAHNQDACEQATLHFSFTGSP